MKKRLIAFFALTTLVIPTICAAAPAHRGPYAAGYLGASFPKNSSMTSTEFGAGAKAYNDVIEFDPGVNIGGGGGFDFGFLRIEGELTYKYGEMSTITEQSQGTRYVDVDGKLEVTAVMFNTFLDLHNDSPVTPYFGGGVGFATLYLSDTFATDATTGNRARLYRSDDDSVFAYQIGAGMEIDLTRRFSLDLGYRYFGTSKANFNRKSFSANGLKFEGHNVAVGIRVRF